MALGDYLRGAFSGSYSPCSGLEARTSIPALGYFRANPLPVLAELAWSVLSESDNWQLEIIVRAWPVVWSLCLDAASESYLFIKGSFLLGLT